MCYQHTSATPSGGQRARAAHAGGQPPPAGHDHGRRSAHRVPCGCSGPHRRPTSAHPYPPVRGVVAGIVSVWVIIGSCALHRHSYPTPLTLPHTRAVSPYLFCMRTPSYTTRGHSQRSSNLSHGLPSVVEPDAHYCWVSPDEKTSVPFSREWAEVHALACEYDLCLTGDALTHIQQLGLEDYFVPLTQVGCGQLVVGCCWWWWSTMPGVENRACCNAALLTDSARGNACACVCVQPPPLPRRCLRGSALNRKNSSFARCVPLVA